MNKTKSKILSKAISLYNEYGFTTVTNQQIAKAAEISLSNFNYHFATKQDLVHTIFHHMKHVLVKDVYGQNSLIDTGNGWEIARRFMRFEYQFKFFYLETPIIHSAYPELQEQIHQQFDESIQLIKNLSYLAIGKGLMRSEPPQMPGLYDQLAEQIWMNNHFWLARTSIRGIENDITESGLQAAFAIVYPYLTKKGIESFQSSIENIALTVA